MSRLTIIREPGAVINVPDLTNNPGDQLSKITSEEDVSSMKPAEEYFENRNSSYPITELIETNSPV